MAKQGARRVVSLVPMARLAFALVPSTYQERIARSSVRIDPRHTEGCTCPRQRAGDTIRSGAHRNTVVVAVEQGVMIAVHSIVLVVLVKVDLLGKPYLK